MVESRKRFHGRLPVTETRDKPFNTGLPIVIKEKEDKEGVRSKSGSESEDSPFGIV